MNDQSFLELPKAVQDDLAVVGGKTPEYRSASVVATILAARELVQAAGITRIADITGLDVIDVPVVSVVRPNARSLSIASGKGTTLADAYASGIMEALEMFHGETFSDAVTVEDLGRDYLRPTWSGLPTEASPSVSPWEPSLRVSIAMELNSGEPAIVPYDLVHLDLRPAGPAGPARFQVGSNGLAGGNCFEEAALHGLCELIERDAVHQMSADGAKDPVGGRSSIDWDTVDDDVAKAIYEKCRTCGIEAYAFDITSHVGVPTYYCRLVDSEGRRSGIPIATDGSGCHLMPALALRRSLTEAIQTRMLLISGARDDIRSRYYQGSASSTAPDSRVPFNSARPGGDLRTGTTEGLSWLTRRLFDCGHRQVMVVDLRCRSAALSFVRVIVPGLKYEPRHEL